MILQDYILDSLDLEPTIFIIDDTFSYKGEGPLSSDSGEYNSFPDYERFKARVENIFEIDAAINEWRERFPFRFSVELCNSSEEFIDKFKNANQFTFCIFDLKLETNRYDDGLNLIEYALNKYGELNYVILSANTNKKKDIIKKFQIPANLFFKKQDDIDNNFKSIGDVILQSFQKNISEKLLFVKIDSCWDSIGNKSVNDTLIIDKLVSNTEILMPEWVYTLRNILSTKVGRNFIYTKSFTLLLKQISYEQYLLDTNNLVYCRYIDNDILWLFDPFYSNGAIKIKLTDIDSINNSLDILRSQVQLISDFNRKLIMQFFINSCIELYISKSLSAANIKTYISECEIILSQGYELPLYPYKEFHFINQLWENLTLANTDINKTELELKDFVSVGYPEVENIFFGKFINNQNTNESQNISQEDLLVELKGINSIDYAFNAVLSRKRILRSCLAASKFDCFRMVIHYYKELDNPYFEPLNSTHFEK